MSVDYKSKDLKLYNTDRTHELSLKNQVGYANFSPTQESYVLRYGEVSNPSDQKPVLIHALHYSDLASGSAIGVSWKIGDMDSNISSASSAASAAQGTADTAVTNALAAQTSADAAQSAADAAQSAADAAQSSANDAQSGVDGLNTTVNALQDASTALNAEARLTYLEGIIASLLTQ
jgi:hypothetical protein